MNSIINDYIERKKEEAVDKFCVMLERAGRDSGESSNEWSERLEIFLSEMAQEIFGCLPQSKDINEYQQKLSIEGDEWNSCRSTFLENIKKLK
jgi:hypothetical protein